MAAVFAIHLEQDCLFLKPFFQLFGSEPLRWTDGFLLGFDAVAVVVVAHRDHDEIAVAALADACH